MRLYKVRVTWRAETEVTVEAENSLQAEEKARKKAARDKPSVLEITDTRAVTCLPSNH
jgi:hypothetical protein